MQLPREFLQGMVDYAGLFPPAGLPLTEAAANYAAYRRSDQAWMLGSFVVGADRLGDLADLAPWDDRPWPLSVLVAGLEQVPVIERFLARTSGAAVVAAVEARVDRPAAVQPLSDSFPMDWAMYFEAPAEPDPVDWIRAIGAVHRFAKLRTGGITAEMIPSLEAVARFMQRCAAASVPFKATAGLHHPLRGARPLTYEADAPIGIMHGFLNVFVAAALATAGGVSSEQLVAVLSETDPEAFAWDGTELRWRDTTLSAPQLGQARTSFAHSFGSCSFEEPVDDLQEAGLL